MRIGNKYLPMQILQNNTHGEDGALHAKIKFYKAQCDKRLMADPLLRFIPFSARSRNRKEIALIVPI